MIHSRILSKAFCPIRNKHKALHSKSYLLNMNLYKIFGKISDTSDFPIPFVYLKTNQQKELIRMIKIPNSKMTG